MVTFRSVMQELQEAESSPEVGSSKNITGGLLTYIRVWIIAFSHDWAIWYSCDKNVNYK